MKAKILVAALLLGVLGLGRVGSVEGASGGWVPRAGIGYLPDLYVSSHVKIDYGTYVAVGFTVTNGGLTSAGPFSVSVVPLSSSPPFDIAYGGLGAGQSKLVWFLVYKRATPAGTPHYLAVDSYFQVGESNESNNLYTLTAP
jgi:hypothetical protein